MAKGPTFFAATGTIVFFAVWWLAEGEAVRTVAHPRPGRGRADLATQTRGGATT